MCALILVAAFLSLPLPPLVGPKRSGHLGSLGYSFSREGNKYVAVFTPPLSGALQLMGAMARLINEAYGPGLIVDMTVRTVQVGNTRVATWKGKNGYTYCFIPMLGARGEIVRMVFWRSLAKYE